MVTATRRKRRTVSKNRVRAGGVTRSAHDTAPSPAIRPTSSHVDRRAQLIDAEIDFIANEAFLSGDLDTATDPAAESAQDPFADAVTRPKASVPIPPDMPAHLARLCAAELLTADQERDLFRRMNYLKFRANGLRISLDPDNPSSVELDQIEQHLAEAQQLRDHIIEANMRLVISIVKRFVTPQFSFDDLLSEGIRTLLIAVEKFDYGRGFRFSTYAYRAISRNAYRAVADRQKDNTRFTPSSDTLASTPSEDAGGATMDEQTWEALRAQLAQFVHQLDRRERFIIRGRYALGSHRNARTFQDLADRLGLSKERVRQLEQRALGKLKKMAADVPVDELVTAAAWQ